jgi:hypothetical protein
MAGGNPSKLKPCTPENARERQLKSAEKRKENNKQKKLMSQLYIETLEKRYNVKSGDNTRRENGYKILGQVVMKILQRGDSSSVAMIKEIREATEGSKINLTGEVSAKLQSSDERLEEFKSLMDSIKTE